MLTALLSGEVTIGFLTPINAQPQIKAGRLPALAVTSRQRLQSEHEFPQACQGKGQKLLVSPSQLRHTIDGP